MSMTLDAVSRRPDATRNTASCRGSGSDERRPSGTPRPPVTGYPGYGRSSSGIRVPSAADTAAFAASAPAYTSAYASSQRTASIRAESEMPSREAVPGVCRGSVCRSPVRLSFTRKFRRSGAHPAFAIEEQRSAHRAHCPLRVRSATGCRAEITGVRHSTIVCYRAGGPGGAASGARPGGGRPCPQRLEHHAVRGVDGQLGVVVGGRDLDHVHADDVVLVARAGAPCAAGRRW